MKNITCKAKTYTEFAGEQAATILLKQNFPKLVAKLIKEYDGLSLDEEQDELRKLVAKEEKKNS
jgi:hypothetical protein